MPSYKDNGETLLVKARNSDIHVVKKHGIDASIRNLTEICQAYVKNYVKKYYLDLKY